MVATLARVGSNWSTRVGRPLSGFHVLIDTVGKLDGCWTQLGKGVGSNQGWGLDAIIGLGVAHDAALTVQYNAMSLPWWLDSNDVHLRINSKLVHHGSDKRYIKFVWHDDVPSIDENNV